MYSSQIKYIWVSGIGSIGCLILESSREIDLILIRELARNGRVSVNRLSRLTGLAYTTIRERLNRLRKRKLLAIKPLVSTRIYGSHGILLRLKTRDVSRVVELLMKCNRVVALMTTRDSVIAILVASSTVELTTIVDSIIRRTRANIEEYVVEYGRVPENYLVPLRNPEPVCSSCRAREVYGCNGCLPILRIKK